MAILFALQFLMDAMRYEGQVKNDLHIFSFSLYELAMVHISRDEVILWGCGSCGSEDMKKIVSF